jgi:hypothetical protein
VWDDLASLRDVGPGIPYSLVAFVALEMTGPGGEDLVSEMVFNEY